MAAALGACLRRLADAIVSRFRLGPARRAGRGHDRVMDHDEAAFVVEGWPPANTKQSPCWQLATHTPIG